MDINISKFLKIIIIALALIFSLHVAVLSLLDFPIFENKIILAYSVNTILAIIIYVLFYKFKEMFKNQIGFVFIFGSFLKFIFFFLLFNASYRADGDISALEFLAFFVPYFLCLIIEIFSMSKWLNKDNNSHDNHLEKS
jgi:hypothetical protein